MNPQQGTPADPKTQQIFDVATKQVARLLMSEQAAMLIYEQAKAQGPDVAIAEAVTKAVQAVAGVAEGSGVQMPPDVIEATSKAVAMLLVGMMVKAGIAPDGKALMAAVMQRMAGGAQPAAPQAAPQPARPQGMLGAAA